MQKDSGKETRIVREVKQTVQEASGHVERTLRETVQLLNNFAKNVTGNPLGNGGIGIVNSIQLANLQAKDLGETVVGEALKRVHQAMAHKQDQDQNISAGTGQPSTTTFTKG